MFPFVTLIVTPFLNIQMVGYFDLMEVWGRENDGGVFLCLACNIKILVTASYVVGKCWTDVFESVFCDARGSMELLCDQKCLCDNAVSLYFLEKPHFTLVQVPKVFKNNVWNIYSASPTLHIFIVTKISYVPIHTKFLL